MLILINTSNAEQRVRTDTLGSAGADFTPLPGTDWVDDATLLGPSEVRLLKACRAEPVICHSPANGADAAPAAMMPRLTVEEVSPSVAGGDFPVKRTVGDLVQVEATVFASADPLEPSEVALHVGEGDVKAALAELESEADEYRTIAERRVRLGLLLSEIGAANGVEVSQREMNQLIGQAAAQYQGKDRERFLQYIQQEPMAAAQLRAPLYEDKVVDFLFSNADVTDRTATREQLEADLESEEGHVHGPGCGHDVSEAKAAKGKKPAKAKAEAAPAKAAKPAAKKVDVVEAKTEAPKSAKPKKSEPANTAAAEAVEKKPAAKKAPAKKAK